MSNPREWHLATDSLWFFVMDEYGEDLTPEWRGQSWATAQRKLKEMADNYEPRDPPGWEGGFAPNH